MPAQSLIRPNALVRRPGVQNDNGDGPAEPRGMLGVVQRRFYRGKWMEYQIETERRSVLGTGELWGPCWNAASRRGWSSTPTGCGCSPR